MREIEKLKCKCCKCYDNFYGCKAWSCDDDFELSIQKIKEAARENEMSIADITSLLNLAER